MDQRRGYVSLLHCCLLAAPLWVGAGLASAQQAYYFRHDHAISADAGMLPEQLSDQELLWKQPLPAGQSTPLVVGDRLLLTAHEGKTLSTLCLARADGTVLWKQGQDVQSLEKVHAEGSPASASCASDGRHVVSFFGSFGLLCYDLDGKPQWQHPLGPFRDEFGSSSSPIVLGDKVFLNEDHDLDSFLLAINLSDGSTAWRTSRDGFTRSYATPVVWQVDGRPQLIVAGALQLMAYDPQSGRALWSRDGFARIVNTTPVVADGKLYVCTWSPGGDTDARIAMEPWGTALDLWDKNKSGLLESDEMPPGEVRSRFFRIDLDSNQALDQREWEKYARLFELAQNTLVALAPGEPGQPPRTVWEYGRGLPYVASPLVYQGIVFLVKDGGIVTLLDAETGKLLKQARSKGDRNYYASPVGADGKVYLASSDGVVTVLKADKQATILGSRDFGERIAATPVASGGRLYVRTDRALYCFGRP